MPNVVDQAAGRISARPARAAGVIAALVVICIILAVKHMRTKTLLEECKLKRGFLTPGIGNFEMAGNNPLWYFGNADAGSGGSLARETTPQQLSIYMPQFRRANQRAAAKKKQLTAILGPHREQMSGGGATGHGTGCGSPIEPGAAAEVTGLLAAQAYGRPAEGTAILNSVISDAVDDTAEDTTPAQIARMYSAKFRDAV